MNVGVVVVMTGVMGGIFACFGIFRCKARPCSHRAVRIETVTEVVTSDCESVDCDASAADDKPDSPSALQGESDDAPSPSDRVDISKQGYYTKGGGRSPLVL